MMTVQLTPEAFGTLRALANLGYARRYDPIIGHELVGHGLADYRGQLLFITDAGRDLVASGL